MHRKNLVGVNGGLSGGSSVRQPRSEDPHQCQQDLFQSINQSHTKLHSTSYWTSPPTPTYPYHTSSDLIWPYLTYLTLSDLIWPHLVQSDFSWPHLTSPHLTWLSWPHLWKTYYGRLYGRMYRCMYRRRDIITYWAAVAAKTKKCLKSSETVID
jgi:hypothetical protein